MMPQRQTKGDDSMDAPQATVLEAGIALDALAALSVRLSCHCDVHPDTLVLPARKVQEACAILDAAVLALKEIVVIAESRGGATPGSVPRGLSPP